MKRGSGPEPERLKIELPWEQAVRRALNVPLPPGGVPERVKPKRGRPPKKRGV
jgi:hypothetical protein